ncbi:MAG TPA: hypothetical protein VG291_03645 [Xanthobacteraceae bacterium]|nr:hypothetical protein [Xanthobacteraceae bacterium]
MTLRRVLRRPFDAALQDPALLAEVARMQLAVAGTSGERVQALIRQVYATPPDVVAKAAPEGDADRSRVLWVFRADEPMDEDAR